MSGSSHTQSFLNEGPLDHLEGQVADPPAERAPEAMIGVDVGGTFTDFASIDVERSKLVIRKVSSSPTDPERAVLDGLDALDPSQRAAVAHGTTVATNALLERRGARVAFVTTAGFGDLLRLGRGERSDLYALSPLNRPALVDDRDVHEVAERLGADGEVVLPLTKSEARRVAEAVADSGANSVAICTLHSYLNPRHERSLAEAILQALRSRGKVSIPVACSAEVLPEMREYERASTTVVNAYLTPPTRGYLERLTAETLPRQLTIMGSHGGTLLPVAAARTPVATLLSGPAAGVAGALYVGRRCGIAKILTFDMGGTSTDVAACDGAMPMVASSTVDGFAIGRPMVDVHTVGAGGGSIVRLDEVGALRVGPQSAGAVPGPACYGRGGAVPTVTDANAVLGRLPDGIRLGGGPSGDDQTEGQRLTIRTSLARSAFEQIAGHIGCTMSEAALDAIRVAESVMERALRRITIERGIDPIDMALVAFGGAGPLHACALASTLGSKRVLLPTSPGALSAIGLLVTPRGSSASRTILRRGGEQTEADIRSVYSELDERCFAELTGRSVSPSRSESETSGGRVWREADVRYRGQSWELTVPWIEGEGAPAVIERFENEHEKRYGFRSAEGKVDIVTLRSHAEAVPPPELPTATADYDEEALIERAAVFDDDGMSIECPVVRRGGLRPGRRILGPAIITQHDSTAWLPAGWHARVMDSLDLILERQAS